MSINLKDGVTSSLFGNADTATSATKATNDSSNNNIASTYLRKDGGTLTGDIAIQKGANPKITLQCTSDSAANGGILSFENPDRSQAVQVRYSWHDTERAPFGLIVERTADNTQTSYKSYLQVEGEIYADGGQRVYHAGNKPSLSDLGAASTSHNHTSLTGVTSIAFSAESSDSASIKTTVEGANTYFDFNLSDDATQNDQWRWRFNPSGGTLFNAMVLNPVSLTEAELTVTGKISASNAILADTYISADRNRTAFLLSDSWLRLNPNNQFTSGIYCGTTELRTDGQIRIGSNGVRLQKSGNDTLRVTTPSYGYVEVGPLNADWAHFTTDRPKFWFSRPLHVMGEIYAGEVYDKRVYHEGYKPTPADIGAATSGHTHSNYKEIKRCAVGSENAGTNGWYKVASGTITGYGNQNLTLAINEGYGPNRSAMLEVDIRGNNGSLSSYGLYWIVRRGFSVGDAIVNVDGTTWTLYLYKNGSQYGKILVEAISDSTIGSFGSGATMHNSTMPESTTPTATWTAIDGMTVATANTLSTSRNFTIGNTTKSFNGGSNVSWSLSEIGAIPLSGSSELTGNLEFANSGTAFRGMIGMIADSDYWRVGGAATASNAGYLEIATGDDQNEPIYVRQYSGKFSSLARTATLLDGNGNTSFPGMVTADSFARSGGASSSWGSIDVTGSKNGWQGVHFKDYGYIWMVRNDGYTGMWKNGGSAVFAFDQNGSLATGSVPWSRLTSVPSSFTPSAPHTNSVSGSGAPAVNAVADANTIWKSGFYESSGGSGTNFPSTGSWYWLIHAGHTSNNSGGSYNYGMQIAGQNSTDNFFIRSTNSTGSGTWRKLWHAGNLAFGTGATNMATGNHTHSYLPLSGGTMTGNVLLGESAHIFKNSGDLEIQTAGSLYLTSDGSNITYDGASHIFNSGALWGDGSGLTSLNASNLASGTVPIARIPTGTTSATVSLGNHTHSYLPLSGGTITGNLTVNSGNINNSSGSLITSITSSYQGGYQGNACINSTSPAGGYTAIATGMTTNGYMSLFKYQTDCGIVYRSVENIGTNGYDKRVILMNQNGESSFNTVYCGGNLFTGSKTSWNDGKTGTYIGSDGTMHLSCNAKVTLGFHYANSTSNYSSLESTKNGNLRANIYDSSAVYFDVYAGSSELLAVGSDSTSNIIRSNAIYNRTYSNAANIYITSAGTLGRSTSASKYKLCIEKATTNHAGILDLEIKAWFDKSNAEAMAKNLAMQMESNDESEIEELQNEDILPVERLYGLIAEDVESVGLGEFCHYGKDGEIEGIQYDRLWINLIPIVKGQKQEIQELKEKNEKMEQEIEKIKEMLQALL